VAQPAPPVDPAPAPGVNAQAQAAVADARKAWRDGNAEKAIMALQAVAAQYPDTPEAGEALLQVADINLVRAQPRDARFALDAFLKAAPTHPRAAEAFLRRGQVEEELNDLTAAEADYREVLKAYDTSLLLPDAHLRLGLLLKKRGKVKEARDELGVALRQSRAGDNVNRQAFDALLKLQKQ
jgi:TolA-binding protein